MNVYSNLTRDIIVFSIVSLALFILKYPLTMSDFKVYYLTGERVIARENIYNIADLLEFKYLPISGIIFSAFAFLKNESLAKILWYFFNSVLIFFTIYKTIILCLKEYQSKYFYCLFTLFALYFGREMMLGQINMLMILLALLSIESFIKEDYTRSGIFLGFSIWVKPYTLIFLPYYLLRKNYRGFFAAIGILSVGLIVPFFIYGIKGGVELYLNGYEVLNETSTEANRNFDNISIWSFYAKSMDDFAKGKILSFITVSIIYSLFLYFTFQKRSRNNVGGEKKNILFDSSVLFIFIPLFSPQGWYYQLTIGMLAILLIGKFFKRLSMTEKILFVICLLSIPFSSTDIAGKQIARFVGAHSLLTFCFLIITLLAVLVRYKIQTIDNETKLGT